MKFYSSSYKVRGFRRFGGITRVLVKHGLGDVIDRTFNRRRGEEPPEGLESVSAKNLYPSPERLRRVLEELGPSFIKMGQLMSLRADLFPPEYINELKKLQDSVPAIPFSKIKPVLEDELARPLRESFGHIDEQAMATASVAQVHLARLTTGEQVVIKVVRPGIQKKIRDDIRLMYYLAEKIENNFEIGKVVGVVNLVKEFERTIFREMDMFIEAGNMEKFRSNFESSADLHIPRVYWEYTSRSVLVMEHIEGIKMDKVDQIVAHGIDPKEIAMIGLRSFSRQLMEFGYFHADPHPGNTIVMYDGRVSLVDFGIIGYLDEETMLQIANIFLGYAEHDYDMVLDALWQAGLIEDDDIDLKNFRLDLKDMSEPFYGRALQTISVKDVYDQVMGLVLKYQLRLPRNLLLLLKTLIQTEALGKILGSDANLLEVMRPYAKKLLARGYEAHKLMRNMNKDARSMGGYVKLFPKFMHDILKLTARGKHRIELWHSGFQHIDVKLEKGVNRLTVGIIIAASVIAGSLVLNSSQKIVEFTFDFYGRHTISITSLLGLVGYSMATVLGFWLIIAIFRSGKM